MIKKQLQRVVMLVVCSLFFFTGNAQVKIGANATTIDDASLLELESTSQGLVLSRMTGTQRDAMSTPLEGMMIYNLDLDCIQVNVGTSAAPDWQCMTVGATQCAACVATRNTLPASPVIGEQYYATDDGCIYTYNGSAWTSVCPVAPTPITGYTGAPTVCATATISATGCSSVGGATLNNDTATTEGIEYDWTGATTSGMANTSTTRALVDISGQCWMRYDMSTLPSNFSPAPTWVNSIDTGWSGYFTGGPFTNEGFLYQWSAAMNNSTTERAQGVCPTGWHVPSDCEWMYLENNLGMSTGDQGITGWRYTGTVGSDLSTLTSSGNNNSGFTALHSGYRSSLGNFVYRGAYEYWWSSSEASATTAVYRYLSNSRTGVYRHSNEKSRCLSVRCLKD